ncbi:hypothetical protein G7046_g6206 [Stylonectria norvegica]|nr:hypothetical protein G7046_g6206 [Stylonectria norvegica]
MARIRAALPLAFLWRLSPAVAWSWIHTPEQHLTDGAGWILQGQLFAWCWAAWRRMPSPLKTDTLNFPIFLLTSLDFVKNVWLPASSTGVLNQSTTIQANEKNLPQQVGQSRYTDNLHNTNHYRHPSFTLLSYSTILLFGPSVDHIPGRGNDNTGISLRNSNLELTYQLYNRRSMLSQLSRPLPNFVRAMGSPRGRRYAGLAFILASLIVLLLIVEEPKTRAKEYINKYYPHISDKLEEPEVEPPAETDIYKEPEDETKHVAEPTKPVAEPTQPHPQYLPTPTWAPPEIKDPFPLLSISTPPPIPEWNVAQPELHKKYGIDYAPPLLIGFTRTWPLLLQAVVSYITAGWPADQIYVIENTGVHRSNLDGKLSLQNPFYLNHDQLKKLGVNVVRSPVLMSFAQLQNFFIDLAEENNWPYYYWSHMDVLALSYEDGKEGITPAATEDGYKSIYELCLAELKHAIDTDDHWAIRLFAYDHLALVKREAYVDVRGWDTFIPYYMTDCDMHSRLMMNGWTLKDAKAGIVTDVSTNLDDLIALYRNTSITPSFTDPNPPPPKKEKRDDHENEGEALKYWRKLQDQADSMWHYKHGDRDRNTWQLGQTGGLGEPYYYPARGIAKSIDLLTETGREIYRQKWGHNNCDLIGGAGLALDDQWLVKPDF